jgi:hypothetical protein
MKLFDMECEQDCELFECFPFAMLDETATLPRSAKPLCLGRMAPIVFTVLKEHSGLSSQAVADSVIRELGQEIVDGLSDRTLRRRIYDVLNVFLAAGIAVKEGKALIWKDIGLRRSPSSRPEVLRAAIRMRAIELADKVQIYTSWRLIIERNKREGRRDLTVPVAQTLLVGFRVCSGDYNHDFNRRRIEVLGKTPPLIYSPLEVITKLGFTREQRKAVLLATPQLGEIIPLAFPEEPL